MQTAIWVHGCNCNCSLLACHAYCCYDCATVQLRNCAIVTVGVTFQPAMHIVVLIVSD